MQIVIVGDGKVGLTLTQMLTAEGHNVTVIDSNPKVLARTQEEYDTLAVCGHGASRAVLAEAGTAEADLLIAATNSDETNLLSCLIAKKMGCQSTIARVRNPEYADDIQLLQQELGLAFAINPEDACAREIFRILQIPSFLAREQFAKGMVEIVRFHVREASPLIGRALRDLHSFSKIRVLVCAVDRASEVIIPSGDFLFQKDDDIFVASASADLATLIKSLGLGAHKVTQVSIVGGSRVGYYLAHLLTEAGVGVKLFERDAQQARRLSELLPHTDIVEGDGTERDTLLSEGVNRSDALVALTGIDEENIVLSAYARLLGVGLTVTKCNREQYTEMFHKMELDAVVSPKMNCAEEIVRYVRAMVNRTGSKMITLHRIAGGKAEALEFLADASSHITGIPLTDLSLKKGLLIACISRGRQTIIPSGATVIQPGDSVVVVTAGGSAINDLEDILAD